MNNNTVKYIVIGILGLIVLVLSILGIGKYRKNNSIDIHFGIGNHGIGSGNNGGGSSGGIDFGGGKSKTKKGNFIKCIAYEDTLKATGYFEFRNGTLYNMMQYEISGEVPADYMKEHTKKEVESELSDMLCSRKESACGNVKFSWSGRKVTMTLGVDINVMTSSLFKTGMTESEFLSNMSKDNETTCEKVSKAPIYATKIDSSESYLGSSNNYNTSITEKKYKDSTSNTVKNQDMQDAKKSAAKSSSLGFIESIEAYAGFSEANASGMEIKRYDVPIPGNGKGVTCTKTNKGWDSTCKAFMTAVEQKSKVKAPDTATIILNANNKIQQGTKMAYFGYGCVYDGIDVTCK